MSEGKAVSIVGLSADESALLYEWAGRRAADDAAAAARELEAERAEYVTALEAFQTASARHDALVASVSADQVADFPAPESPAEPVLRPSVSADEFLVRFVREALEPVLRTAAMAREMAAAAARARRAVDDPVSVFAELTREQQVALLLQGGTNG